ncbi:SAM-dependent DNA methyltransferase [Alkalicella caledoniensis]|uniref:site-specific DNA-methyltransferase (adenine-specific) n=1 Tax=Alkalicella caledoniensis TaxID=2731377 RepID=A0A7G9WB55_ALKCA|nr:class I SAM-dependent DNA methyltransferase [Alkalicella caledoniensis]QNO15917.1 SAM-dependent DNA methyltransferase [Alkalicella caledoniensis]
MNTMSHNQIVSFIWGIADDCLRDVYVRGKYRDVILPMTVIRRLDAVLEETKESVLEMKKRLDEMNILNQTDALCSASGQAFYNSSPFVLKDLKSRVKNQQLRADFIEYLDGFSPNVQEILEKFKFRNQIDTMIEADILGAVIEKFVSPTINLSPKPVLNDQGEVRLSGLDNHTMGVIFEELIRKFNEENNEEAGEHFTPRDVVELMADVIFMPIKDKITDGTYLCYDGASGTGGMLTIADERLTHLAEKNNIQVSIHLYGQEINPETYAIAKADLLLKGDGTEAENIKYGSTLSNDGNATMEFDFMLSNPPYGKSWKTDAERLGGKSDITDPRFIVNFKDEPEFKMIPRVNDGQMLFLANNIAKMKHSTELGSRIAEVHNGSSIFTGDAGQGESNLRRYIIESDYLEAIIALPENMFYNTGIATYIWVLSNRKEEKRKGKVQLIDATSLKSPLRKNLGDKNCELTKEIRKQIMDIYLRFEENEYSKIFNNEEFGYWKITVNRPLRLKVEITHEKLDKFKQFADKAKDKVVYDIMAELYKQADKDYFIDYKEFEQLLKKVVKSKGEKLPAKRLKMIREFFTSKDENAERLISKVLKNEDIDELNGKFKLQNTIVEFETDKELEDTEQIPLRYEGGIETFFKNEVLPYAPDAWVDHGKTQIGYEISFTKYFYKSVQLRSLDDIMADIKALEEETEGLLEEIIGG